MPAPDPEEEQEERIDAAAVRRYFDGVGAQASAASSMAHARKLPPEASLYRKECELAALQSWLDAVPATASVLDVGCGDGYWTAVFAARYRRVVGMDQSPAMAAAAGQRLSGVANARIQLGDMRSDLPQERFDLIFAGGVCMYLNDDDVEALLRSFRSRLTACGVIILRESTVRQGRRVARGDYQAIYRSVSRYRRLCENAGARMEDVRKNIGYERFEIGADIVDSLQRIPALADRPRLNRAVWRALCAAAPLSFRCLPRWMDLLGIEWPRLQNHFFLVAPQTREPASNSSSSAA